MRIQEFIATPATPVSMACSDLDYDILKEHIGFAAHRAILVLIREFVMHLRVRPVTFNALVLIGANPGVTQSELASALMLDKGTTAHLLRDLEQQGWIERRIRPNDRRWKGVYLSPRGVQEAARLKSEVRKLAQRIHSLYTAEEHRQLLELLNRIPNAVEAQVCRREPAALLESCVEAT
jgi:DNA-binding MarR family transcriptional regulator